MGKDANMGRDVDSDKNFKKDVMTKIGDRWEI